MGTFSAFIDESGNTDLETAKDGVTQFYVLAAVVVETNKRGELDAAIEKIRATHYGTGEIKSSKTNEKRRLRVIKDLLDTPFKFIATVVDKTEVRRDSGLVYKTSFIKFLNGLLYRSLVRRYQNIHIYADQQGREAFMSSFRAYIRENHIPDLFEEVTLSHVVSSSK